MELLPPLTDPAEFAEWRRRGVGASDIAALLNLSPWSSPWALWADKTGVSDPIEQTDAMTHGLWAERSIVPWYEQQTGLRVTFSQYRVVGAEPWMRATPDGFATECGRDPIGAQDISNAIAVLECKATADSPRKWDEDGIPTHYQTQATWQSIVTGIPTVVFAVLHVPFGRISFATYEYTPDESDKALVEKAARAFWFDCVEAGVPPDADAHPATTAAIRNAYDVDEADDTLFADEELLALVQSLRTVKADIAAAETQEAELSNRIKARMQDCGELRYGADVLATWRVQTRRTLDAKRLRAEFPTVADEYTTESRTRTFLLKTLKGDN